MFFWAPIESKTHSHGRFHTSGVLVVHIPRTCMGSILGRPDFWKLPHVRIYAFIYAHRSVYAQLFEYVRMFISATHVYMYVFIYICICIYIYIYIYYVCIYMCICTYGYMYGNIMYASTDMCIHLYRVGRGVPQAGRNGGEAGRHTHTHTDTHRQTHTDIQTHTHIHTQRRTYT